MGRERREEQACEAQGRSLFDCADLSVRGPPGPTDTGTSHRCLGSPPHSHRMSLNRITSEPQEAE